MSRSFGVKFSGLSPEVRRYRSMCSPIFFADWPTVDARSLLVVAEVKLPIVVSSRSAPSCPYLTVIYSFDAELFKSSAITWTDVKFFDSWGMPKS